MKHWISLHVLTCSRAHRTPRCGPAVSALGSPTAGLHATHVPPGCFPLHTWLTFSLMFPYRISFSSLRSNAKAAVALFVFVFSCYEVKNQAFVLNLFFLACQNRVIGRYYHLTVLFDSDIRVFTTTDDIVPLQTRLNSLCVVLIYQLAA